MNKNPLLSVCIVTFQATQLLSEALESLIKSTSVEHEIIVVDNGSSDGVEEMLVTSFPKVKLIKNDRNLGFTLPMNQAMRVASGQFILELNPDTIILPGALDQLLEFLDKHPRAGICGPKVLNLDGSLQKSCRRGDARPWAVITYFLGFSALFPRSKFFSQYHMSYLDPDQSYPVHGVSGSCMLIRRQVLDQIGYLDEKYFAYQEDADYCMRARAAGWQVYYVSEAQIMHYGGMGGSMVNPKRSIIEWHKAYYLLYRKHFAKDYFFLFNWFYYLAMLIKLVVSLLANLVKRGKFGKPKSTIPIAGNDS